MTTPAAGLPGANPRDSLMDALEAGLGAMAELHHLLRGGGIDVVRELSRALAERPQASATGLALSRLSPSAVWSIPLAAAPESLTLALKGQALHLSLDEPVEWLALNLRGALAAGARRAIVYRSIYNATPGGLGLVVHYFGRNYLASGSFADTSPNVVQITDRNPDFDCVVLQDIGGLEAGDLLLYLPDPPEEIVIEALRVVIV